MASVELQVGKGGGGETRQPKSHTAVTMTAAEVTLHLLACARLGLVRPQRRVVLNVLRLKMSLLRPWDCLGQSGLQ